MENEESASVVPVLMKEALRKALRKARLRQSAAARERAARGALQAAGRTEGGMAEGRTIMIADSLVLQMDRLLLLEIRPLGAHSAQQVGYPSSLVVPRVE